jgi:thiol-disulfide isomerase/thioredoxin
MIRTTKQRTTKQRSHPLFLWLGLLFLSLSLTSCGDNETTYTLTDGTKLKFSELKGRVVFINYWAEWCKPCRTEMPELNTLQKEWHDQVQVLAVNYDGVMGDQLKTQAQAMGINFPVLTTDPRQQFGVTASGALPETLVIGPKGVYQKVLLGPQTVESLLTVVHELTTD